MWETCCFIDEIVLSTNICLASHGRCQHVQMERKPLIMNAIVMPRLWSRRPSADHLCCVAQHLQHIGLLLLRKAPVDAAAIHIQQPRCLGDIASGLLQSALNQHLFSSFEIEGKIVG